MNTAFEEALGSSPQIKVLDYLLSWEGFDVTITDIAKGSKISRVKTYSVVKSLIRKGVLIPTRNIGNANFFKLDGNNIFTKQLRKLYRTCVKQSIKELEGEK